MRADVDVIVEHEGWAALDLEAIAARVGDAALEQMDIVGPAEIALLATSDAAVAELNAEFRDKPTPTNVLSWPAQALAPEAPGKAPPSPERDAFGDMLLGDIALAFETCAREAEAGNIPLSDHTAHLLVHAILHLLGYDHLCDEDARLMEGLEAEILLTLGVPNPYIIDD